MGVANSGFTKLVCIPEAKIAMIKDLKLEILICFYLPTIKHWTPLHQTPHILHIPSSNSKKKIVNKCSLSFRIKGTMCEDLILIDLLSTRSPGSLPFTIVLFEVQQ